MGFQSSSFWERSFLSISLLASAVSLIGLHWGKPTLPALQTGHRRRFQRFVRGTEIFGGFDETAIADV